MSPMETRRDDRVLRMIKAIFLMALGAIGALQGERWLGGLKQRVSPRALTDGALDRANRRLEKERSGPS